MSNIILFSTGKNEFCELKALLASYYKNEILIVQSKDEIWQKLTKEIVDVLIIDLELKDTDAILLCAEIREEKNITQPYIIIVSEKTEDYIQTIAFDSGADDFLIKPLKASIVAARIKAMMKRKIKNYSANPSSRNKISIDVEKHQVTIDSKRIVLPRKEFNLLYLLYTNPGKIFTRTEIAKHIWGDALVAERERRTIDVHLSNIRSKIGDDYIRTVSGIGYIFNS